MRTMLGFGLPLIAGLLVLAAAAAADDTIYDIQLLVYPEGTVVNVEEVIVTGVGRFGFCVQEPEEHPDFGWQYSGIWVYTNVIPSVRRGDLVNVTGTYEEYWDLSEIDVYNSGGTVTVVGQATVPDPVELLMTEVNNLGAFAEAYESVLIRVDRLDDTLHSDTPNQYNEWWLRPDPGAADEVSLLMESLSALPGGDFEYDVPDSGTVLSYAQGILTYNYEEFKLAPRNCDEDLGMACKPRVRGAYATSPSGVNVQFGVPITQESAENIANYELVSGMSVLSATLDPGNPKRVLLTTDDLGNGEEEEIIVTGIVSQDGAAMDGPESAAFRTGYTPIRTVQFIANPDVDDTSPLVDEVVTLKGRVTGLDGANYYFMQDDDGADWDGIYVRVAKNTPLSEGREVIVAGRVREYFGMTQLSYSSGIDHYRDLGYSSSITTNLVTNSDIPYRGIDRTAEPWEGCLVRLEAARLDSVEGVTGPYFDEWLLFQDANADTAKMDYLAINGEKGYDACIGDVINLTGLLGYDFSEYAVWPRSGRGIDIEVVYDNPDCEPTAVEEVGLAAVRPVLRTTPNPFNPRTTLFFRIDAADVVRLEILDPSGRVVRTLLAGIPVAPGQQQVVWDGRNDEGRPVGTGTYFARLQTREGFTARKMILLK